MADTSRADRSSIDPPLEPAPSSVRHHHRSFATIRVVAALILREMATRYGRTPGGYFWAFVEPIGMIMVLAVGFSILVRNPSLGNSFLLFYASGYLPYVAYREIQHAVHSSIFFSRPLLVFPAVTWVDAMVARFTLNLLTNALVVSMIIAGILYLTDTRTAIDVGPVAEAILLAAILGFGTGALDCLLGGMWPIWETVSRMINRPLMLLSGVFYIYEDLPMIAQNILWWNPLLHVTGIMRTGIFPTYQPQYLSVTYILIWALVTGAIGMFFLRAYHQDIINMR